MKHIQWSKYCIPGPILEASWSNPSRKESIAYCLVLLMWSFVVSVKRNHTFVAGALLDDSLSNPSTGQLGCTSHQQAVIGFSILQPSLWWLVRCFNSDSKFLLFELTLHFASLVENGILTPHGTVKIASLVTIKSCITIGPICWLQTFGPVQLLWISSQR